MIPNLPRPFLWTEIKTTREFLDGDYFCPILFDMYSYFYRTFISPQKNNVVFLNEFYYQLTRVYYEKPSFDEFDVFINDITKDIGRQPRADLLLVMIYHYIRLRDGGWTANKIGLLRAINERLSSCRCWTKFESVNLPPRIPNHSKIDPRSPSPVSPMELVQKNIDWKETTHSYDLVVIKEIMGLWKNKDDKRMVAAMIEMSINKIKMIYPHHELDFQIVRDYFRREKLLDDSAALDPLAEIQKLKAKLERLEKKNRELEQQHVEDDARMLSGFGAPIVEVYENGIKAVNQQIYDTDKNHRIIESKSQNEPGMSFVKTKSIVKNHFIETTGKLIVNSSPTHEKEQKEIPISDVEKSFRYSNSFVKNKVADVIRDFYQGEVGVGAFIEITLYDHNQLIKRNSHKAFVKALVAWGLIEVADEKGLQKIVSAVTDKHKRMPQEGYQKWTDNHADDKSFCEKIGRELGESMHYNR